MEYRSLTCVRPCPRTSRVGCGLRYGFTLVELLVVIAIVGILIALLLPAVQAAREAARRIQCSNQVKQMMLGMHNHVSAHRAFPSGGIAPWPKIEDYVSDSGAAMVLGQQGLSWGFQILPYLEEGAVHDINTAVELEKTNIGSYYCPSRRAPTQWVGINPDTGLHPWLFDYAAAVPNRSRDQVGDEEFDRWTTLENGQTYGCLQLEMWGTNGGRYAQHFPQTITNLGPRWVGMWGVIVRSDRFVDKGSGDVTETGFYRRISFKDITDGSASTLVLAEKRLRPSQYESGDWHDDKGWSDGWDPDTLRSTICFAAQDGEEPGSAIFGYGLGSAHSGIMNSAFADGSVRTLNYDIDVEILNRLGHRSDGEIVDLQSF